MKQLSLYLATSEENARPLNRAKGTMHTPFSASYVKGSGVGAGWAPNPARESSNGNENMTIYGSFRLTTEASDKIVLVHAEYKIGISESWYMYIQ